MNRAHVFGHKMIVITYKRSFVKYDQLGDINFDKEPFLIKHEGVYMFGGVIGERASDYQLSNETFFLPIGDNVTRRWRSLPTKGKHPEGRFHHALHYYDKGNIMVVLGGRRFVKIKAEIKYDSEFVN